MASYHCTVKTGGKGRAAKHADYIEREGQYAQTPGRESKLEDLEHKASGNMPAWAEHDASVFWQAADEHERSNGATYREIEVALPRELTPAQRVELVEDFVKQQIGERHPFTYAIHIPKAAIEKGEQPHAHIMYSERTLDGIARDPDKFFKRANTKNPEKGGCKKDSAGTQERLLATRELWAEVQNKHLEKAGSAERVTHLSLKAQGIARQPEKHLGPVDAREVNAAALLERRAAERELAHVGREPINAAAELAEQARAAEAARQAIQAAQETAARQAAQVQAQREAAGRAAAEQAAQAQAQAAAEQQAAEAIRQAQAQAQAQAAEQARAAAINAKLTAEKQEKEDDRIRATALAALAKASRSTDRAGAFAVADHEAAERTSHSNRGTIESSRGHLVAAAALADQSERNPRGAIEGAERRIARSHTARSAPAVREQLGGVNRILQQAGQLFSSIAKTIAAAAREVTTQRQKAAARAPERPAAAPVVPVKVIPAPAPEKPLKAVSEPAPAYQAPKFDTYPAQQEAYQMRQEAARLDVNREAEARGLRAVPFPPGLTGQWATGHHSSFEMALTKARQEAKHHAAEPRPEGFWKKKETAAYDAKTAELGGKVAGWEKEIEWRAQALMKATAARQPEDAIHVARAKEAHDQEHQARARAAAVQKAQQAPQNSLTDITRQVQAAQAQADPRSYLHNSQASHATAADYTKHIDGKIVASNAEYVAVNLVREVKIFKVAELEKQLVYTGTDTGRGRFAQGNELEIKRGHKSDATLAYVREQRDAYKTQAQKERENSRGR